MVMFDGITVARRDVFRLEGEFFRAFGTGWKLVVSVLAVLVDICVCCSDHEHDY